MTKKISEKHKKILDEIVPIITEHLEVDPAEVTMDAHLENDLGADSLDKVEVLMKIERNCKVSIPDAVQDKIDTIGKLVDAIDKCRNGNIAFLWLAITNKRRANTVAISEKFKTITK